MVLLLLAYIHCRMREGERAYKLPIGISDGTAVQVLAA